MDALKALDEAKTAVVALEVEAQNRKAEIRQLKKYANESERNLRALLLSGHRVEIELVDGEWGSHILRVRAASRQGLFEGGRSIAEELQVQTELDLFSMLLNDVLRHVWDGVW